MAYCPRCGVKVEDRLDRCPLCDTPIPVEARDSAPAPGEYPDDVIPPTPMYRPLTAAQKRSLVRGFVGFLAVFPIALTILLDVRNTGGVTWSWYVAIPITGTAVIAWVWYRFGRLLIRAAAATLVTLALVYVLLRLPGADYSFLHVITTSRVLPLLLVMFLAAVVYIVYFSRVRRRGLNVAGFLFLELTVLLGILDFVISGTISWSAVTGLVFVPIAIVLYTLHIALFNDTDWRKALHL